VVKVSRWPTVVVALAIGLLWLGLAAGHGYVPTPLLLLALSLLGAWYGSLQHEVIHGHLPTWVGWAPLGLLVPFCRYRTTHIDHHRNELLTDPVVDPESFYVTSEAWATASTTHRFFLQSTRTLVGRMLLGPLVFNGRFIGNDLRGLRRNGHAAAWVKHLAGVATVVVVVRWLGMPLWIYVLGFMYGGSSITLLRSFVEHRAVDNGPQSAMVLTNPALSLLFLNNNLHFAHHAAPGTPWFALPALSRDIGAIELARSGAGVYDGYRDVVRRYAFHPFCQPVRDRDQVLPTSL
jgi:fatty acid desaturase